VNPLLKAYYALRYLGPGVVRRRAALALRSQLGLTRRVFRPRPWASIQLDDILRPETPRPIADYVAYKKEKPAPFLFPLGQPPTIPESLRRCEFERRPTLTERLGLLAKDHCVYFLHRASPEPIDWYHNPFDDTRGNSRDAWCDIPDFLPEQGDPRVLWEPSRGAWAFDLARARARGLDVGAGALFWRWLDSWMAACPPFSGFQWKCGQESAVRFIAVAIAFWALANDMERTADRWLQFARLAWATGYRISRHIEYALSQNNNHALSEACGLILISHLFPEFHEAPQWSHLGRTVFARGIRRQVYADGSYIQHSMNYHRVLLHVAVLSMRLAELIDQPFERSIYDRAGLAAEFLHQMGDRVSGRAPNYGHNDGACVLPLTECDASDYRPVLQSAHYLVHRKRLLGAGPWDEEVLWLFGKDALAAPHMTRKPDAAASFPIGGYYKLSRGDSWAMIRCHEYRDRPGQCDPLHVDLWWKGVNVLRDCGTCQYYLPQKPDVERYFALRRAHNTIDIDRAETVKWVTRFLYVPFPKARCTRFTALRADGEQVFEGEQYDYDRHSRQVLHRRSVVAIRADLWVVVDDFVGRGSHLLTVRWHLADYPYELSDDAVSLRTPNGPVVVYLCAASGDRPSVSVSRGKTEGRDVSGVAAPYYSSCVPIPTVTAEVRSTLPQRLLTVIGLGQSVRASQKADDDVTEQWELCQGEAVYELRLQRCGPGDSPVYLSARLDAHTAAVGAQRDRG